MNAYRLSLRRLLLRRAAAPALLCCCGLAAAAEPRTDPPQGRFEDTWMSVIIADQKVGYVHSEKLRRQDEINTRTRMRLLLKRAGMPLELTIYSESTESVTGTPLAFRIEESYSQFPVLKTGTIKNGEITLTTEQFGQKSVSTVPYPSAALMEWGSYLQLAEHRPTPGTVVRMNSFVPAQSLTTAVPTTIEVFDAEPLELFGRTVSAIRTKTTTELSGVGIESLAWVGEDWSPVKQVTQMMGLTIEMIACEKAEALKDLGGAEMFINTLIPVPQHIDRNRATSVTYTIRAQGAAAPPEFPETAMQKVVQRDANSVTLKVSRVDHAALKGAEPRPLPDAAEYLAPSTFVNSNDPTVVQLARDAAGSETDPYELARRLTQRVAQDIETKDLGTAFATASEVCRRKAGDCTEHGVLLAALGRALGIPTRVVTGLIYVERLGDRQNVLGFHMWTQFWIAGQWVDLDASWEQVDVDPTHIVLGTHSTRDGAIGGLVSAGILKMSNLQVEISDIQYRP